MYRPADHQYRSGLRAQGSGLLPPAPSPQPRAHSEQGIALLIVVSMLTVIGIMGVAFAFSMFLETQEGRQFVSTNQARYLAEAGVSHARVLLDEDRLGSRVDEPAESWAKAGEGSDVDVDGDGALDARWWPMQDTAGEAVGRYAVKLTDEGGKANLNAALADPSSLPLGAINLTTLLEQTGVESARAREAAQAIEQYRYGGDGRPGVAGVDDDHNGAIDDVGEYQPTALRGDDRRLEAVEDLAAITSLSRDEIPQVSSLATVYSWDPNVSVTGKARVNVNTATADELLAVLLDVGVENPWQAAVNMADAVDPDLTMSQVNKSTQVMWIGEQGTLGSWVWRADPEGHYESDASGGDGLSWLPSVPTGSYRVIAHGLSGRKVGDVSIAGQLKPSVGDGESLGVLTLSATPQIVVANREPAGTACAFRGLELVSEQAQGGVVVRGIEAVRFNELMVEPTVTLEVSAATFDAQSSDWACPVGSAVCTNSGVGQARWTWTSSLVQPAHDYLRVFGASTGQTVGDVRVEGTSERLVHGQRYSSTVLVSSDRKVSVTIGKTTAQETYYLKSISLSVQPDAEYVEFINMSDSAIDLGGWTIEGELTGGRQARLPSGSIIKAHGLLVAAVDLDDTQSTLAGNAIDARSMWTIGDGVNAVQLEFPNGAPSPDDDWLKVTLPAGQVSRLILRNAQGVVDEVEYPLPLPTTAGLQSLEKGDPSVIVDTNQNGVDEGWYPSLRLFTPGATNDNEGLKEVVGLETIVHDPSKEVMVLNRPLTGVGELAGLASGEAWKPFASEELAKVVDRLTVEGHRLEAEGYFDGTEGQAAWEEKAEGFYVHTDARKADVSGRWRWTQVPDGRYRLSVYGWSGEQLAVRWQRLDGTWSDWSPDLSTDGQGRLVVGEIAVGMGETTPNTMTLEMRCASASGICHVDYVRLDPQLLRIGPVNVNTAPLGVLLSLPGMTEALAGRIIAGRPYGDQHQKGWGIGDLLLGSVLGADEETKLSTFRRLAHLLTTHSDVFQILSVGQAMDTDRVDATQRIQTIVQR